MTGEEYFENHPEDFVSEEALLLYDKSQEEKEKALQKAIINLESDCDGLEELLADPSENWRSVRKFYKKTLRKAEELESEGGDVDAIFNYLSAFKANKKWRN